MSRPEQEVTAELSRLGCRMNQKGIAALAQDLRAGETVLDALGTNPGGHVQAVVLTSRRVFGVTYSPRSWLGEEEYLGVTYLDWQDVERVYSGERYGDRKTRIISVSGYSNNAAVEVDFYRGHINEERYRSLVDQIHKRAASAKSPPAPTTPLEPPGTPRVGDTRRRA